MPESRPFFSVVIPVHNKARYVKRSIRAVVNQSYTNFELLLIDDASTDDSLGEMKNFADARIRILRRDQPGPGGYAARNLGIREAEADWVAFLDADDEWYPDHLQTLHALASHPDAGVIATGWFDLFDAWGEAVPSAFSVYHTDERSVFLEFTRFLHEYVNHRRPVWTGVVAARRNLLAEVGGFPEHCRRGGDSALWLRLVAESGGIHVSTARTAVYHREASSVTRALAPETQRNCVYQATQELLRRFRSPRTRRLLMRVSNLHILPGLKSRALAGTLGFKDCREYYFLADWSTHTLFRIHSLLPAPLQPRVWRLYQKVKRSV